MISIRGSGNIIIQRKSDRTIITATESKSVVDPVEQYQMILMEHGVVECTHYITSEEDIIVGS
jgi:hypothetical protein